MKKTSITCDICEQDIQYSSNCVDYRLAIVNESVPSRGGPVTAMMKYPILDEDCHLCSYRCLLEWAKRLVAGSEDAGAPPPAAGVAADVTDVTEKE